MGPSDGRPGQSHGRSIVVRESEIVWRDPQPSGSSSPPLNSLIFQVLIEHLKHCNDTCREGAPNKKCWDNPAKYPTEC